MITDDRVYQSECKGKIAYLSRREAMTMRKTYSGRPHGGQVDPYRCSFCDLWHLGHRRQKRGTRRQKQQASL